MSITRVVIEIEEDQSPESVVRALKDANRRQAEEIRDHWIDLETPFLCFNVTRVLGVVANGQPAFGPRPVSVDVIPLEAL